MSRKINKLISPKSRNPYALPAKMKKAGPMKDRRLPKGGSKNEQTELQEELEDEIKENE